MNPYYSKFKGKASNKKESGDTTDYGTFNTTRDGINNSQYEIKGEKITNFREDSDYVETAFQKIKLPSNRGLINA